MKEKIKIQKQLLNVYSELNEDGKLMFYWEFGEKVNSYILIGMLEDIKQSLLDDMDERVIGN